MKKIVTFALMLYMTVLGLNAKTEEITIQGSKGKLAATLVVPKLSDGQKCPIVILMHGFMGNRNGIIEKVIADKLEKEGIATLRFDFNGHGQSEGEFVDMTVPNEIEDALKVYEYAKGISYVSTISFAGHSQGGVVAAMAAGELVDAVEAVVLFAPAAVLREDAIRGNTMGARYNPLTITEPVKLFKDRMLGVDYIKTAFSLPIYETAAGYKGPACIIHGTADTVVPYTYGERFHDLWYGSEYHCLDGYDHGFSQNVEAAVQIGCDFLVNTIK